MYDDQLKTYSIKTQEYVFELLNSNVTTSRISPVITCVLKLVGIKPNNLPSVFYKEQYKCSKAYSSTNTA